MQNDFVRLVHELKEYKQEFCLSPRQWRSARSHLDLDWYYVKFTVSNRDAVPQMRGVYAFVVEPQVPLGLAHGYLMYFGETGHDNHRTLRDRYGDYLRDQNNRKRSSIHYMLNNWRGYLYFYFAEIPDRRYSLKKLETVILDALIPPFNAGDFSADIRAGRKAW